MTFLNARLRASARLRDVAKSETALSAELVRIAEQIEEDAAHLEASFREKPPTAANDADVA